jgi:hypothetical protein
LISTNQPGKPPNLNHSVRGYFASNEKLASEAE